MTKKKRLSWLTSAELWEWIFLLIEEATPKGITRLCPASGYFGKYEDPPHRFSGIAYNNAHNPAGTCLIMFARQVF